MAFNLPVEGEEDWDDKLNESITFVKDAAEAAQADADTATSLANEALGAAAEALEAAETAGAVTSVAGQTGAVTLTKSDVGLGNVDNTADSAKAVFSATKLATARTINGTSFDGTENITLPAAVPAFTMAGNVPGELVEGELVEGGVSVPIATTLDKILLTVNREPRGSDLVIGVWKRTRTTGTETLIGTATIEALTKRTTLTGLGVSLAVDDRIMFRATDVGTAQSASGLEFTLLDSTAPAFPTELSSPAAPTGGSAVVASTTNVTVSWTAPASGAYFGVDVYKDDAFLARVLKGTTSYTDIDAASDDHEYKLYAVNTDNISSALTVAFSPTASTIGDPVQLGVATYSGPSTSAELVITLAAGVSIGSHVIVMMGGSNPQTATNAITVTDSEGNTYATDVHAYSDTHTQQVMIASAKVTSVLSVSDTITITCDNATARLTAIAYSVSGLASASHLDKTDSNNVFTANASSSLTTTQTATLSQTKEIAFAAFSAQATSTTTVTSGWSMGTKVSTTSGSNDKALIPLWQKTSTTGGVTGTCQLSNASAYSGAVATYKGA